MGLKNWARRRGPIFLIATALIVIVAAIASVGKNQPSPSSVEQSNEPGLATVKNTPAEPESLDLSEKQHVSIKIERVCEHTFPVEKRAVGSIDFNEDLSAQVFTPYQGKIIALFAKMGDEVRKGQTLFTIDSPDLLQAESTLIASAGVLELTVKNLERQRNLYKQNAAAQRDYEQAISDHQTAEGALKAARDAVRIFGKTDAEIDKMVADRKIDFLLDRAQSDRWAHHGPECRARSFRAARHRARALRCHRYFDDVDGRQRHRKRHPELSRGPGGAGQGDGLSGPCFHGKDFNH